MNKPLKIAIFSGSIPSATFIEHLIHGVAKSHTVMLFGVFDVSVNYKSHQIHVYSTPKSHFRNLLVSAYRTCCLGLKSPIKLLKLIKEVKKYKRPFDRWIWYTKFLPIVLYKPDIFHIQWARDIGIYYFLKDLINCKIVVSLLGSHINYSPITDLTLGNQYYDYLPKVDAFHAVSEDIKIRASHYGADINKITVIKSPIQSATFEFYKPYTKSTFKTLKLLSVGRHHWVKGYSFAIGAMNILKESGIKFTYDIIAQGTVPEELIFQKNQLNLNNEVSFFEGISPQSKLFERMLDYDALILSSLSEGIANVVLEAMAVGLPVISTNCGGMAEVVIPGETGWLVPVRDSHALAEAIIEVLQTSEQDLQRITANAHQFVKEHFNAEDRIGEFLEFYEASRLRSM